MKTYDDKPENTQIVVTNQSEKPRGILKQNKEQKEAEDWKKSRAEEMENDKRRIQFDLKKELKKLDPSSKNVGVEVLSAGT